MNAIREEIIIKYDKKRGFEEIKDALAVEEPLEIRLAYGSIEQRTKMSLTVTMRTPGNDIDLVTGFLFGEGIIQERSDILTIQQVPTQHQASKGNILQVDLHPKLAFDPKKLERHFYTTSSCGVCGKTSIEAIHTRCAFTVAAQGPDFSPEQLFQLQHQLNSKQTLFNQTGGLHAAAIFNKQGQIILVREDIGRHNAVDKVVGALLIQQEPPMHAFGLLVSGRAGFELVQKAVMAGIKTMVAVGAPSSLAVQLAQNSNIRLVGFLKKTGFNDYGGVKQNMSHKESLKNS